MIAAFAHCDHSDLDFGSIAQSCRAVLLYILQSSLTQFPLLPSYGSLSYVFCLCSESVFLPSSLLSSRSSWKDKKWCWIFNGPNAEPPPDQKPEESARYVTAWTRRDWEEEKKLFFSVRNPSQINNAAKALRKMKKYARFQVQSVLKVYTKFPHHVLPGRE